MVQRAERQDPRTIITPDAFSVAPELLGLPLAHPWRRAAAILIDLLLVAILANARAVFFALAAGLFVFWLAVSGKGGRASAGARRAARVTLGCLGAATLTIAGLAIWFGVIVSGIDGDDADGVEASVAAIGDLVRVAGSGDSTEIAAAAERLVERLGADGALQDAGARTELSPDSLSVDELLARYSSARADGDSAAMAVFGPPLGSELAAERLGDLGDEIERGERREDDLRETLRARERELDEERNRGLLSSVFGVLDDVGLGLGWSGLYFTFFLGWWKGRTPGKRLLGIRVVRLDGRPLGYWVSFERFGGYAASLFTGLEGFARIIWDPNRQALEDKLAGTVVLRDLPDARARVGGLHARGGGAPRLGERLAEIRNAGG